MPATPGGPLQSDVSRSYNSFSGSDIRANIGPYTFAELQAVSYSITREKAPIYTLGSADPRAFSRNKRGIAGSLIWINFDRHGLLNLIYKSGGSFVANVDDLHPQYSMATTGGAAIGQTAIFSSSLVRDSGVAASAPISQALVPLSSTSGWKEEAAPWFSDQILPFDITLSGSNENGAATGMRVFGCELISEGAGVSIDDAVQEMQGTFVARSILPWQAVSSPFSDVFK